MPLNSRDDLREAFDLWVISRKIGNEKREIDLIVPSSFQRKQSFVFLWKLVSTGGGFAFIMCARSLAGLVRLYSFEFFLDLFGTAIRKGSD